MFGQGMSDRDVMLHFVVVIVFTVLATAAVILRFWARRIQKANLRLNDFLIILGLVAAIALSIYDILSCCGFFTPKPDNPEAIYASIVQGLKSAFISPIIWVFAVTIIRASILTLFIDIFRTPVFRTTCWVVFATNLAFFFGTVLASCLICRPISFRWDQINGAQGTCGDQKSLDLFIAIFNLLLDAVVVVLPMPVLSGLNMKTGKKAALVAIFGMGIVICAITAYRVYVSSTIAPTNSAAVYPIIALLATLEALLGIINACLPILKPISTKLLGSNSWTKVFRRSRSGKKDSGTTSTSGSIPIILWITQVLESRGTKTETTKMGEATRIESPASMEQIPRDGWKEKREMWRINQQSEYRNARSVEIDSLSKQGQVPGQKLTAINVDRKEWDEENFPDRETSIVYGGRMAKNRL